MVLITEPTWDTYLFQQFKRERKKRTFGDTSNWTEKLFLHMLLLKKCTAGRDTASAIVDLQFGWTALWLVFQNKEEYLKLTNLGLFVFVCLGLICIEAQFWGCDKSYVWAVPYRTGKDHAWQNDLQARYCLFWLTAAPPGKVSDGELAWMSETESETICKFPPEL